MKISIIVPVYNSEEYLERCLNSIILSLRSFEGKSELLLIDNGSTDNSMDIIKKYHKNYPNLIVVGQCKTKGAAAARNYGIKMAKGEYAWFNDADDTIREDAVARLIDVAEKKKADLVMLGMQRIYSDGHTDFLSAVCPKNPNYKSRFVRYGLGPVQVLFRRKWWIDNKISFHEGIIHEDMELMSSLILYTDNFACVDEPLYYYYQNQDSVLHQLEWNPHCFDIFPALESLYEKFQKMGAAEKFHDELEWFFIWNLLIDSAKDFSKFKEGKPGFARTRKMLKEYFPKWRKNRFLKQKPLKLRILVRLNYYK